MHCPPVNAKVPGPSVSFSGSSEPKAHTENANRKLTENAEYNVQRYQ